MRLFSLVGFKRFEENSQFIQNSPFENLIFDKIHIFKDSFLTNSQFQNSHIQQNSQFQKSNCCYFLDKHEFIVVHLAENKTFDFFGEMNTTLSKVAAVQKGPDGKSQAEMRLILQHAPLAYAIAQEELFFHFLHLPLIES